MFSFSLFFSLGEIVGEFREIVVEWLEWSYSVFKWCHWHAIYFAQWSNMVLTEGRCLFNFLGEKFIAHNYILFNMLTFIVKK